MNVPEIQRCLLSRSHLKVLQVLAGAPRYSLFEIAVINQPGHHRARLSNALAELVARDWVFCTRRRFNALSKPSSFLRFTLSPRLVDLIKDLGPEIFEAPLGEQLLEINKQKDETNNADPVT